MPTVDFWLDWRVGASVDRLRALLPGLAAEAGYRIEEVQTITSAPGWAMFALRAPQVGSEPVGTLRAQEAGEGASQVFVGPGAARDTPALAELNRASLQLYVELVRRGLLAPPAPLEPPERPLAAEEA